MSALARYVSALDRRSLEVRDTGDMRIVFANDRVITCSLASVGDDVRLYYSTLDVAPRTLVRSLSRERELGFFGTSLHVITDVRPLGGTWLGVRGHGDGEGYDTVIAVDASTGRETHSQWGYKLTIGPAGLNRAVVYRDAECEDELAGFEIWDLVRDEVVQRIPYICAVPLGAEITADEQRIFVKMRDRVLEVMR